MNEKIKMKTFCFIYSKLNRLKPLEVVECISIKV